MPNVQRPIAVADFPRCPGLTEEEYNSQNAPNHNQDGSQASHGTLALSVSHDQGICTFAGTYASDTGYKWQRKDKAKRPGI
jgi:hypothetical protein